VDEGVDVVGGDNVRMDRTFVVAAEEAMPGQDMAHMVAERAELNDVLHGLPMEVAYEMAGVCVVLAVGDTVAEMVGAEFVAAGKMLDAADRQNDTVFALWPAA
jgi:hypothetical protein